PAFPIPRQPVWRVLPARSSRRTRGEGRRRSHSFRARRRAGPWPFPRRPSRSASSTRRAAAAAGARPPRQRCTTGAARVPGRACTERQASAKGWIAGAGPGLYCRAGESGDKPASSSRNARGACMDIAELLAFSVKNKASDLHLSAGLPPMIRVDGDVRRINIPALDHKQVHALVYDIMSDKQRRDYEEFLEVDFSFEIAGLARFRVNAF